MPTKRFVSARGYGVLVIIAGTLVSLSHATSQPTPLAPPRVVQVSSSNQTAPEVAGLEEDLTVAVENVEPLLTQVQSGKRFVLYIDDIPLKGVYPESFDLSGNAGSMRFFLSQHSPATLVLWGHLIRSRKSGEFFTARVPVSVGVEDGEALPTNVTGENGFTLVLVRKGWFYGCVTALLGVLILFMIFASKSDMLRDNGPNPPDGARRPYSLARTQMAIWFFIILSSWLLLYAVLNKFDTITETLVILMGISAGTGVGSAVVEGNKTAMPVRSSGFLLDILSDNEGVSFHRFQIFAWTIILVIVFVRSVVLFLAMPEFDGTLLALMGISSGTYLGYKATSPNPSVSTPPPAG